MQKPWNEQSRDSPELSFTLTMCRDWVFWVLSSLRTERLFWTSIPLTNHGLSFLPTKTLTPFKSCSQNSKTWKLTVWWPLHLQPQLQVRSGLHGSREDHNWTTVRDALEGIGMYPSLHMRLRLTSSNSIFHSTILSKNVIFIPFYMPGHSHAKSDHKDIGYLLCNEVI